MKLNAIALMVALGLTSSAVVDAFVVPNSNSHPNYALRQRTATATALAAAAKGKGNIQTQGQSQGGESNSRLYASTTIDTMSSLPNYGSDSRSANVQSGKDDSAQDVKVGVLLLNLGGPEKTEDVEGKSKYSRLEWKWKWKWVLCLHENKPVHKKIVYKVMSRVNECISPFDYLLQDFYTTCLQIPTSSDCQSHSHHSKKL